ncbi:MAG: hypothetical protein Q8O87_00085 [bacterium]|nr:hypothetical protein [bacterium]
MPQPKVIVCGRWNRHSSTHEASKELWRLHNATNAENPQTDALKSAQSKLAALVIRQLEKLGVDLLDDGGIKWDSIFDVTRRIQGCHSFTRLSRIPETNHFHRQPKARLPLIHAGALRADDLGFAKKQTQLPIVISLPGPYTTARQTENVNDIGLERLAHQFAKVFGEEIRSLIAQGAALVRIEEPQIIAHPDDWRMFRNLMTGLTDGLPQDRLVLATWFGNIPQPQEYFNLPFGWFWVDMVESGNIAQALPFVTSSKNIIAGIVDARQPLPEEMSLLTSRYNLVRKFVPPDRLMLAPNTDLHFLPWDEAIAKVKRLVEFARVCEDRSNEPTTTVNPPSHLPVKSAEVSADPKNNSESTSLITTLAHRTFPTSTVGSFPQPQEVRKARIALRRNEITLEHYREIVERHTRRWIEHQEQLDITVPVGGEFLREDMAAFFGIKVGGELGDFVPSYENRRYHPIIYDQDILTNLADPLTVADFKSIQRLAQRPVKETLTGPATMADWALLKNQRYWQNRAVLKNDFAAVLRQEILQLIQAGARIIQIDEPALTTKMMGFASDIEAITNMLRGLEDKAYFILHICYSDMEALQQTFPQLLELPFHQIHMEMANRDYALIPLIEKYGFAGKDIGLGVLDVHTDRIETPEEIATGVERTLAITHNGQRVFRPQQIWLTPDCGLKERGEEITIAKLQAMKIAAEICRRKVEK